APDALHALEPLVHRGAVDADSTVVLLQNGVLGLHEHLVARLPKASLPRFVLAASTHGAAKPDRDRLAVRLHGSSGETLFGRPLSDSTDSDSDNDFLRAISCLSANPFRLATVPPRTLHAQLLLKLATNCALNPLTAVFNARNGQIARNPNAQSLIHAICCEIVSLPAFHPLFPSTTPLSTEPSTNANASALMNHVLAVANATSENHNSMDVDVVNSVETEINFLNAYLLRLARESRLSMPLNKAFVDLVALKLALNRAKRDNLK
ncbi:2-dehydropantoate 2-reductase (Ketopantoate reductase) (KPA reductase) (KPR), partial [Physocladia obscura]